MIGEYCPECGHLLSNDKLCSFCNFYQSNELLDDGLIETFDWEKEDYYRPILYMIKLTKMPALKFHFYISCS